MGKLTAEYPEFSTWAWTNYDENRTVDVLDFIKSHAGAEFYVGTDSQNYKKKNRHCTFTTGLCAYHRGKGGSIIIHKDKTPYKEHLRQRLLIEAMRSLETAWFIERQHLDINVLTIHLDVNENLKYESSKYKEELVGLIVAQGFNAAWKPNSWAASSCADAKT